LNCRAAHRSASGNNVHRLLLIEMVLPHRIELWTSPLPRECSTTELRQRRCHENAAILATGSLTAQACRIVQSGTAAPCPAQ
jgi:hypothetical protein